MTEEIRYIANLQKQEEFDNEVTELKDELKRLEQENKDFEILAKSLYKRIEELEKENEALAFRERLYKADYEASEQENKELKEVLKSYKHPDVVTLLTNWRTGELDRIHNKIANERDTYRSALKEIRTYLNTLSSIDSDFTNTETYLRIQDKINEVLSD